MDDSELKSILITLIKKTASFLEADLSEEKKIEIFKEIATEICTIKGLNGITG